MKSYTDLEQSKRLVEFLPLESADMFYNGVQDLYKEKVYNIPINGSSITVRTGHTITERGIKANLLLPSWSLAALLEILDYPQLSKDKLGSGKVGWMVSVYPDNCRYDSCWHDNPLDACYEMILKLYELNLL